MAEHDWAIVVGIQVYPAFDQDNPLRGPENDAKAFKQWLVDPAGGNVPQDHVKLIVSSAYNPPFASVSAALPTTQDIQREFEHLLDIADANSAQGNGRRVGARLYLYFAGHGFSPDTNDTAVLAANASRERVGSIYHVLGKWMADWFFKAGYFDEILLFMDCCREDFRVTALNQPWPDQSDIEAVDRVKRFYAFGTRWSHKSFERPMDDGLWHGAFTTALLSGLRGDAYDPAEDDPKITADSLEGYLKNNLKNFLSPQDLNDPDVDPNPEVRRDDFVILTLPTKPRFSVTIHFSPELVGQPAQVRNYRFDIVARTPAAPAEWPLQLERGRFLAECPGAGREKSFEVAGTGAVDEQL